jgi:hypothetical protein
MYVFGAFGKKSGGHSYMDPYLRFLMLSLIMGLEVKLLFIPLHSVLFYFEKT